MTRTSGALALVALLAGCMPTPGERVELDRRAGQATTAGASLRVDDGLAAVRRFTDGTIELWAQAPALGVDLVREPGAATTWTLTLRNAMPDAELVARTADGADAEVDERRLPSPTERSWTFAATERHTRLVVAPPEHTTPRPFRFAVLSDVQEAVDEVSDIFDRMNQDPEIRFVVSSGDLVDHGERAALRRFLDELQRLERPYFSTIGNHELIGGDPTDWAELFGRFSFHFGFQGASFTFADSGSGTVDPEVYDWVRGWLREDAAAPQVFVTHYPPFDPVGTRGGGFSSRKEAAKLVHLLAKHGADLSLHGHVHSYYAFALAGVPAYISGGGGAIPERLDGIGRHYLTVDVEPDRGELEVSVVRVD